MPRRLLKSAASSSLSWSAHEGIFRASSMNSRRSEGSPSGSACSLVSQSHSRSLTSGMSPRSNKDFNSGSAASSQTWCGSRPAPEPATESAGDQFQPTMDRACAGDAATRAPNAPPAISAWRLLKCTIVEHLPGNIDCSDTMIRSANLRIIRESQRERERQTSCPINSRPRRTPELQRASHHVPANPKTHRNTEERHPLHHFGTKRPEPSTTYGEER